MVKISVVDETQDEEPKKPEEPKKQQKLQKKETIVSYKFFIQDPANTHRINIVTPIVQTLSASTCRGNECMMPVIGFGQIDPCSGTYKYLRVKYTCEIGGTPLGIG